MEETLNRFNSADFWESDAGHVFQNPRALHPVGPLSILPRGALLFATSGSTQTPKWVVMDRAALLASAEAVNAFFRVTWKDRWASALPSFHVGGIGIFARSYLMGARPVTHEGKWDAVEFCDLVAREGVTLTSLVPPQLHDLCRAKCQAPSSLRAVIVGGGAVPAHLMEGALALGWPVAPSFGMTEAASQIATAQPGTTQLQILPCWEARTDAMDRLLIRGAPLCQGYFSQIENEWKLQPARDEDGWFCTRDRVRMEHRTLTWLGREDRVVKILGELVDLDLLEQQIAGMNAGSFALLAEPHERTGHKLILVGEGEEAHCKDVAAQYNQTAPPYARIAEVRVMAELPRSAMGKILVSSLVRASNFPL